MNETNQNDSMAMKVDALLNKICTSFDIREDFELDTGLICQKAHLFPLKFN